MKKGTKIVLLIGILLLALGITIVKIAHHRGESFSVGLSNALSIGSTGSLHYDQKDYTVLRGGEESFSAKEIKTLRIDWLSGSVSVERWDGKDVIVREKAKEKLSEDECLRYKLSGGKLTILPCANEVRNLPEKQLTVLVPQSLVLEDLDVDSASASVRALGIEIRDKLTLSAASGSLSLEDCRCAVLSLNSASGSQSVLRTSVSGDVKADAASGSFTAELLDCDALTVKSASGSQKLSEIECKALTLSAASGSIQSEALLCRSAKVDSASGSVRLSFDISPERVKVGTVSGSVTLSFPQGLGLDLDFDTASGKLRGEVFYGSLPVEVDTASGNLTIEYK